MNYHKKSQKFIDTAFDLLDDYKKNPYKSYNGLFGGYRFDENYILSISSNGKLALDKIIEAGTDKEHLIRIGHTFNDRYSQITYIGKLLAIYLEDLQCE